MILWTFQNSIVTEAMCGQKRYTSSWNHVPDFEQAYRWLCREMQRRIGKGIKDPPVWAWYKVENERRPPGEKAARWLLSELQIDQGVYRLELDVPESYVILSSYSLWNAALDYCLETGRDPGEAFRSMFLKGKIRNDPDIQACLPFVQCSWIQNVVQIVPPKNSESKIVFACRFMLEMSLCDRNRSDLGSGTAKNRCCGTSNRFRKEALKKTP